MATVPDVFVLPVVSTQGTTNKVDFSQDLPMDYEDAFPFTVLQTRLADEKANNIEFKHAVGRQAPRHTTSTGVAASAVSATQTLPVAFGEYFVAGDVIEVPDTNNDATHTNQLYVESVSGDNLTVRAYLTGTYGCATVDAGAKVTRLFSAVPEKHTGSAGQQTEPTVLTKYCGTFENDFSLSDTQRDIWQYTHPERTRLREEIRLKHLQDLETASFLSISAKDESTSTNPRYQMDGIINQIVTNVFQYGAEMDKDELYQYMQTIFAPAYSAGKSRLVFASAAFIANVNKLVDSKANTSIRVQPDVKSWGPAINRIVFGPWSLDFVESPVLTAVRDGWAVVCVPRYMKTKTFQPTTYEMDIRTPGYHYFQDRFVTKKGLMITGPEETFAVIKP